LRKNIEYDILVFTYKYIFMADTPNSTDALKDAPQNPAPSANFLNDTTGSVKSEDTLYNDFFQETGGEMTL
jgi:hypothetical protein